MGDGWGIQWTALNQKRVCFVHKYGHTAFYWYLAHAAYGYLPFVFVSRIDKVVICRGTTFMYFQSKNQAVDGKYS